MEVPGLRVYAVAPQYLLVMKAMAGRPEDTADVQALAAHLGLRSSAEVLPLVEQFVPARLMGPHVRYFLQDALDDEPQ